MKRGDKVLYTPIILSDKDKQCEGIIVDMEPAGLIFKMSMIALDTIPHWVPAHECKPLVTEA